MQRSGVLLSFVLGVAVVTATSPACNLFNDLGDAWANADATSAGAGGNACPAMGGAGGGGGDGGDGGAGGGDDGAGGDGSGVGAGVGGSFGVSVGAGVGGGDSAWSNGNAGHKARAQRHRGRRGGIGTAQQAGCPGMTQPTPAMGFPPLPPLDPLTTTRLRAICTAQKIGAGLTGVQFNRACGLAFETWVLTMLDQIPRNTMSFLSPRRQTANNGLPASVIPEYVSAVSLIFFGQWAPSILADSEFWEVKAVTGTMTMSYSQYQLLGLIDVATMSPAALSTLSKHPPPAVVFTTTGNTFVGSDVTARATALGVALWQEPVLVDATNLDDPNPDLYIGDLEPLNPQVYPPTGTVVPQWITMGAHSKLTSPKVQVPPVPGDPDPPEVD